MSIRGVGALIAIAAAFAACSPTQAAAAGKAERAAMASPTDLSAQTRRARRRPPRITVRPVRPLPREGDLSNYKRDCVPVFEERWIPQWGGRVLYASQRCRWVRDY